MLFLTQVTVADKREVVDGLGENCGMYRCNGASETRYAYITGPQY